MIIKILNGLKVIASVILTPIATIFSIPKMYRASRDPDVNNLPMNLDGIGASDINYKRKQLLGVKYKISPGYFGMQQIMVPSIFYVAVFEFLALTRAHFHPNEPSQQLGLALQMGVSVSIFTIIQAISDEHYFTTVCDEILYPIKRIFCKNPRRFLDPYIRECYQNLLDIGNPILLNEVLSGNDRLKLSEELRNTPYIIKLAISEATTLPQPIVRIIWQYTSAKFDNFPTLEKNTNHLNTNHNNQLEVVIEMPSAPERPIFQSQHDSIVLEEGPNSESQDLIFTDLFTDLKQYRYVSDGNDNDGDDVAEEEAIRHPLLQKRI